MRLPAVLALIAAFMVLASCKPGSSTSSKPLQRIAMLCAQTERSYELAQAQYLARLVGGREDCELQTWDAKKDPAQQQKQLQEALDIRPIAILFNPVAGADLDEGLRQAKQAGILLIGLGESAMVLPADTHLRVDQRQLGRVAATMISEALGRKSGNASAPSGKVILLRGEGSDPTTLRRAEGLQQGLSSHASIAIVHEADNPWDGSKTEQIMRDAMRLQPQFDVVLAFSDAIAQAASKTLGERREEVMVIGMDGYRGTQGGLTHILEGRIDASIYHPPLVDLAFAILEKRLKNPAYMPKTTYVLEALPINPAKAEEYRAKGLPKPPQP